MKPFTNLIQLIRADTLTRDTLIVFSGNATAGVFSIFYYLVAARMLGIIEYGTFNTILSMLAIFTLALQPPHIALIRLYADYAGKRHQPSIIALMSGVERYLLTAAGVIFVILLFVAPSLSDFFQISEINLILASSVVTISLVGLNYTAFLNGHQKFMAVTLLWMLNPISALLTGILFMTIGGTATHALAGFVVGPLALLFSARIYCFKIIQTTFKTSTNGQINHRSELPAWKNLLLPTVSAVSFAILTNADMIAVKYLFSTSETGFYSFAQTLGKLTLFLPFALATVLLPKTVIAQNRNGISRYLLYRALLVTFAICAVIVNLVGFWPDLAVRVISSDFHPTSSKLALPIVVAMSFFALTWITINFSIGISSFRFTPWLFVLAIVEITILGSVNLDLSTIPIVVLAISILAFAASYLSLPTEKHCIDT